MKENTYDDYLDELAEEIGEPLPNLNSSKESSVHISSTKVGFDDANLNHQCPKEHLGDQIPIIYHKQESDMDSLDTRRILNPETPRETAQIFINEYFRATACQTLQCVSATDTFYYWKDNHYHQACDREIQAKLAIFLQCSWKKVKAKENAEGREFDIIPFNTTRMKENEILNALKNICSEGILQDPGAGPSWIHGGITDWPEASMVIPFKNKLLSISDFLKTGNARTCLLPLTPQYFDLSQIPFNIDEHDHGRLLPVKFLGFLREIFDGDESAITMLQQWIGYCLTNMTFAQKILLIIGPPRSGKGTIARVIQEMLGTANYTNPSANSLTNEFPLEDWVNKRLAILGDARFGDKKQVVKEILLQVSGGDRVNVRRKHTSTLSGMVIPAKIMVLSNEMPPLMDNSGALASRFIFLKMTKSFIGSEDPDLFDLFLKPEIPLIFWWALDGLRDLMLRKKKDFVQCDSGAPLSLEMFRYQAPVKSFIEEFCNVRVGLEIPTATLQNAYIRWCDKYDIKYSNDPKFVYFGRRLREFCSSIGRQQRGSECEWHYTGIDLKDRS
jgi:putative DNA primase/helicase